MLRQPPPRNSAPRSRVALSFGSPASATGVGRLDLNEILVRHPEAAFMLRIAGSAMRGAGIEDGDLALVDRALTAVPGQVVIAVLGEELVCRRLQRQGEQLLLQAADAVTPDVPAAEGFEVWGVVTHVVRPVSVLAPAE